jgi:hypothetical protein
MRLYQAAQRAQAFLDGVIPQSVARQDGSLDEGGVRGKGERVHGAASRQVMRFAVYAPVAAANDASLQLQEQESNSNL